MEEALPLGFIILLLCIVCGAVAVAIGIYVLKQRRLQRLKRPAERLLPLMAGRDLDGFGRLFFVPGTLTGAFFTFHALKSDCFCKFAR